MHECISCTPKHILHYRVIHLSISAITVSSVSLPLLLSHHASFVLLEWNFSKSDMALSRPNEYETLHLNKHISLKLIFFFTHSWTDIFLRYACIICNRKCMKTFWHKLLAIFISYLISEMKSIINTVWYGQFSYHTPYQPGSP